MAHDIGVPEPPDLSNRGKPRGFEWLEGTLGSEEFRREDLEDWLEDGAWTEGFNEWAQYTALDDERIRFAGDLGLFRALDFYWDPTDGLLRFDAPEADDWRGRDAAAGLDSSTVSMIETELQDLGRTVQEMLEQYLEDGYDWANQDR